ncbi:MAG TPA: 1-deoxy-D-xylulose-5-phosphate synthase [Candidatus Anaerobiospirillum pullistercoris]|uniref:1-deoxy-D-xylulose-5-phosphate synthase n=1 Tax=Candidatus Anaerobiospirillum pullistercoris TaxID=2838452 RepID=A0A9D2B1Y3_9GAMM|nr:1-deoxy-D-xylulose-5-phosphate synthase [Candidatus Anaerobiospirillum pullistercoris]
MTTDKFQLLNGINDATDVRALPRDALPQLCAEVRSCLIDTVSKTAGHLASGLGVVELTVALHYVYDTPKDIIVWDVGHQAYPHKILTGHRQELQTIRQKNGLHAFIWRGETPYDLISTGHASTSVGSALGLAVAERNKPQDKRRKVIAVIGDGALSGGCAFEALNQAGSFKDIDLTVILNDNEMSISENVGSIAQGLSHVISSPHYVKLVEGGKRILKSFPAVRDLALRAQEHVKGMLMPGTLFEELGFNYIGPVDGNDVERLTTILQNIKEISGLKFLHIVTKKGKGYEPAEQDPVCYHGVPAFNPEQGIDRNSTKEDRSYSAAFGRWLCDRAVTDRKLMGVTPAMRIGSGMAEFARTYPHQFFDVGIAEQHAMVFASGLAAGGLRPVVNIYSSFMQRAYDGLIHDMAIQDLPIMLCLDRGGVVGPDGPTHNGSFDIAYTRTVPNLLIMAPSTRHELYTMMNTGYAYEHPCVIRYPRSNGESLMELSADGSERPVRLSLEQTLKIGQVECLHLTHSHQAQLDDHWRELLGMTADNVPSLPAPAVSGATTADVITVNASADAATVAVAANDSDHVADNALGKQHKIALLCFGTCAHDLVPLAQSEDLTLINMRFIKPLKEDLVRALAAEYDLLVTVEEGAKLGGIGEHIAAVVAELPRSKQRASVLTLGLNDAFIMEGLRPELLAEQGMSPQGIKERISAYFA